jgi:hypothetical protein
VAGRSPWCDLSANSLTRGGVFETASRPLRGKRQPQLIAKWNLIRLHVEI